MQKAIAVMTSGGDAPGMNATVRAVTRTAITRGYKVIGIERGYNGLLNGETKELNERDVSNIIQRGGTVLYTARCLEFKQPEYQKIGADKCREMGIEGIVVIGGDGSFMGARALSSLGIPCIGIPGTIDNDIACTEYTIGYDTAMNTAVEMIDKLRDTAQSHDRCSVVEVMGRHAGWIALHVGIAVGSIGILVPEVEPDIKKLAEKIKRSQANRKQHFIIVVAEGRSDPTLAQQIADLTGIDSRYTILGHVQRGGAPTLRDRVRASQMGYYAVDLLDKGASNRIVGLKDGRVYDIDIEEGLAMKKPFDMNLFRVADEISF